MLTFSGLTVVMYAFVYEDGDVLTPPLFVLGCLFVVTFVLLTLLVVYEAVLVPLVAGKITWEDFLGDEDKERERSKTWASVASRPSGEIRDYNAFSWTPQGGSGGGSRRI